MQAMKKYVYRVKELGERSVEPFILSLGLGLRVKPTMTSALLM